MNRDICLDANVLLSGFCREANCGISQNLIAKLLVAGFQFYAPALFLYELTSALRRKCRDGEIANKDAQDAMDTLDEIPILFQWQGHLQRQALHYAQRLGLKNAYDASYLAVAAGRNMPLVSWDREFIAKAATVYGRAYSPDTFLEKHL